MKLITEVNKFPENFTGIIEQPGGYKEYRVNGNLHRINGPAVEFADGSKEYWVNGKRHREDGPAMEYADGNAFYYVNGQQLTKKQFDNLKNSCDGKTVEIDGKKYKLTLVTK